MECQETFSLKKKKKKKKKKIIMSTATNYAWHMAYAQIFWLKKCE